VSTLDFIASLVDSLAWPAVVVIVVLLLRTQLGSLFDGTLRRLKLGPGGAEFEWAAIEAKTAVAAVAAADGRVPATVSEDTDYAEQRLDALGEVAEQMPVIAIRQAFDVVESELRGLVDGAGADVPYPGTDVHAYLKAAYMGDLITRDLGDAIRGLVVLRDLTAADPGGTRTTPAKARDFLAIARTVMYSLSSAARRQPAPVSQGNPRPEV
jgi:hypothetical protein